MGRRRMRVGCEHLTQGVRCWCRSWWGSHAQRNLLRDSLSLPLGLLIASLHCTLPNLP